MNSSVERRAAPSLLAPRPTMGEGTAPAANLADLMYEGFYALFLLRNGCGPHDNPAFIADMAQFLNDVERSASKLGVAVEDVQAARYAYCAAVDEVILRSPYTIRTEWETRPMQLRVFGEQLAGEQFFRRLEELRARGGVHLQALEVFHMCLLLGFQGRYGADDDKLNYLNARLGDEIARMRGGHRGFAPHAERPDQIAHRLRSDLSLWVLTAVFALAGMSAYFGFHAALARSTQTSLAGYQDVIKLAPRAANVTITLP